MDVAAYLDRIGLAGTLRADLAGLQAVHEGHALAVPFENLDIQVGLPVSLEPDRLFDKIVHRRRGGYCFEQNTLFSAVLREIGFRVETWEARVRLPAGPIRPRTHMLVGVHVEERTFVADVGFGAQGPVHPVPLDGEVSEQLGARYRVGADGPDRVLQWEQPDGWIDLYAFRPEARPAVDFVMAHHFTSTFPSSPFVQTLTVQAVGRGVRRVLRNLELTTTRGSDVDVRHLGPSELRPVLRDEFGLPVPDSARFRAIPEA